MWLMLWLVLLGDPPKPFTEGKVKKTGFFDLYWDPSEGSLYLAVDHFEREFLFIESLATGLGSNDIGLDRGQLGKSRVVFFKRVGNKVFLVQPNLMFRAHTNNDQERRAVAESFAYTTLWAEKIVAEEEDAAIVKLDSLTFRDEHGVARTLESRGEGHYQLDKMRSHYVPEIIKSFPDNTEIEMALTYTGRPTGSELHTVVPTADALTLHQRFSFIRLPDDGYRPRRFHPSSGGFAMMYRDYAVPLDEDTEQRFIYRHRLVRKDPDTPRSELVEPIVYHVDSGAPPLVRDALVEGASWWNEAFEAAGIINGFRVEILPADVDPMDVRYNVIQWVHRSTRGWSYGSSVHDPRTGEIIKGHVSLGSLRVRRDRLLFEGVLPFDENGKHSNDPARNPVQLALARIRQLAAHEVGHTLGAGHNFAASNFGRASVMDYPAPLIRLQDGQVDCSAAYDTGIGEWDKLMIRYLYGSFPNEAEDLAAIIAEAKARDLLYLNDRDGRAPSTMHPLANVWDNGSDPLAEFERITEVRSHLLKNFGPRNLHPGKMLFRLEEVLAPVYLYHRFQLRACVKSLGGAWFDYGLNDGGLHYEPVPPETQRRALALILETMTPQFLDLPPHLRQLIPPRANGYSSHREEFERRTEPAFDELGLVEIAAQMSLDVLMRPERINRIFNQHAHDPKQLGVSELVETLLGGIGDRTQSGRAGVIERLVHYKIINALSKLVGNPVLRENARAQILAGLMTMKNRLAGARAGTPEDAAHFAWIMRRLTKIDETENIFVPSTDMKVPPGSPIGTDNER